MVKGTLHKHRKASARNAKIIASMVVCICVCLSFVGGFLIRGETALLQSLGFSALVGDSEDVNGTASSVNTYNSLSARLSEAEEMLKSDSLDTYDLDSATTEMLNAFSAATEDEYLRYYDPERYREYVEENTQNYAGIGVLFSENKGHAYVVDVFPGSVAESAGVEVGDCVTAIDGDRSQDWSLTEAVSAVSRSEGESVVVTWKREAPAGSSEGEEFTTTLTCSKYSETNVSFELLENVGYILVKQFTQNSGDLTKKAIENLADQGATSFVLDIRNNPGGYLTQAVDVASLFIKSGDIVIIETKEAHDTSKTASGTTSTDAPLVLLVNENTAAAAEALAAALKDNERATVVGQNTLGKGSVQVVRPLSFGGALRYTAAYYKSPLGHDIDKVGVAPDIKVDKGVSSEEDNQKNLALETAQSFVAEPSEQV